MRLFIYSCHVGRHLTSQLRHEHSYLGKDLSVVPATNFTLKYLNIGFVV